MTDSHKPDIAPPEQRPDVPDDTAPAEPGAAPRNPQLVVVAVAAVVLAGVVGLTAVAGLAYFLLRDDSESNTITGTMSLFDIDSGWDEGDTCFGSGGYSDISSGAQVRVTDQEGKTLAVSELGSGRSKTGFDCTFSFTIDDVPKAEFYEVEVTHRGKLSYSHEEMEKRDWAVEVSLGN